MSKFKVGDRVAVYGTIPNHYLSGHKGTVFDPRENGPGIQVKLDGGDVVYYVHPKQCRKLRKKERRKVFIHYCNKTVGRVFPDVDSAVRASIRDFSVTEIVQFVEVKRHKV